VAYFLFSSPEKARDLSITALCEACDVSQPVVFSVCRAVGRGGYSELRLDLAGEVALLREERKRGRRRPDNGAPDVPLLGKETPAQLAATLGAVYIESISSAMDGLDPADLSRAVDALVRANKAVVLGRGTSGHVARMAQYALTRAGVTAICSNDSYVELVQAASLGSGDVALAISYMGEQADLAEAMALARSRKAVTIVVTSALESDVGKTADIVLLLPPRKPLTSYVSIGARIAAAELYAIDVLAAGVALKGNKKAFDERAAAVRELVEGRKVKRRKPRKKAEKT
jgi:DNA-binding MurR/RpiR family transcriptional regulator